MCEWVNKRLLIGVIIFVYWAQPDSKIKIKQAYPRTKGLYTYVHVV